MGYTIKVLSSEEFDRLPYGRAREALGLADISSDTVYVRHTVMPELNKYLLDHELDHLVEEVPTDEIDGVRYKIPLIAPLLGGLGSLATSALPAIGSLAMKALPAIGSLATKALPAIGGLAKNIASPIVGAASKALPAVGGAAKSLGNLALPGNPFGSAATAKLGSQITTSAGPGVYSSLAQPVSKAVSAFSLPKISPLTAFTAGNMASKLPQGAGVQNATYPGMQGTAQYTQPNFQNYNQQPNDLISNNRQGFNQPPQPDFFDNLMGGIKTGLGDNVGQRIGENIGNTVEGIGSAVTNPSTVLGTGLLTAGLNKDLPDVPPLPQSAENLRTTVNSGGGALSQIAKQQLTDALGKQFDPLSEPEIQAALRQLEREQMREEDKVRDLYRNLRPGSDPSSDTSFRRDLQEVSDQFSRSKADTLATRTRDIQGIFNQQKMQQVQQALGADQQQMNNLITLAQMDIEHIMAQLNIDYASAQHFKETFSSLGADLIRQGSGINTLRIVQ